MDNIKDFLPVIAIFFTFTGLLFQYWHVKKEIFKDRIELEKRIAGIETKTDLFWTAIEGNVIHMLKSYPTNIEKDILLDKMIHRDIKLEEAYRLRTVLKEEMKGKQELTIAYALLLGRLEQIIFDLGGK